MSINTNNFGASETQVLVGLSKFIILEHLIVTCNELQLPCTWAVAEKLLSPLESGAFDQSLFNTEQTYCLIERLASRETVSNKSLHVDIYARVLLMHAYVSGYHWNAHNAKCLSEVLGSALRLSFAVSDELRQDICSFFAWIAGRQSTDALPQPISMLVWALCYASITEGVLRRVLESCNGELAQLPSDFDSELPWVLRLDFNGDAKRTRTEWARIASVLLLIEKRTSNEMLYIIDHFK